LNVEIVNFVGPTNSMVHRAGGSTLIDHGSERKEKTSNSLLGEPFGDGPLYAVRIHFARFSERITM
jgi:hypothetical protein